jgi:hypothetical protein
MKVPAKHYTVLVQRHGASSSASSTPRTGLFDHEDEGVMTLEDIGNNLPNDTVAHPRMLESSAIPLCEPQILQHPEYYRLESWVVVRVLPGVFKDSDGQAVHEEKLQCSRPQQQSITSHQTFQQRHRENHEPYDVQVTSLFLHICRSAILINCLTPDHTSWNNVPRESRTISHPV